MQILNFGSINIDHVFFVEHFVRPGETLASLDYRKFAGGKGFNQSIALAYAGADVFHAGKIDPDGLWLLDRLKQNGVDTSLIQTVDTSNGQAIIQVNREGENAIILFGGANREITGADATKLLSQFKFHTINNACLTVWGITIGGSDFSKVISEIVAMGMDNDCTAATAGSIVRAVIGKKHIPPHCYKNFNNTVHSYLMGKRRFTISGLAKRFTRQAVLVHQI